MVFTNFNHDADMIWTFTNWTVSPSSDIISIIENSIVNNEVLQNMWQLPYKISVLKKLNCVVDTDMNDNIRNLGNAYVRID